MYLTRNARADEFANELNAIKAELAPHCEPCDFAVGVLVRDEDGIRIIPLPAAGASDVLKDIISEGGATVWRCALGEDPRPLYFIPFDPSLNYDESTLSSREEAKAALLTRANMTFVGTIGKETPPKRIVLDVDRALEEATYGLSLYWRKRDDVGTLNDILAQYVQEALGSFDPPIKVERIAQTLHLTIRTTEEKQAVLDALVRPVGEVAALQTRALQQEFPFEKVE